jgi:DNA-binding PadR family transcriptional regulator
METKREEIRKNIVLELRRGVITLVVLSRLKKEEYGYTLLKELDDLGFSVDQNTLYPLLRRLEKQGLLKSEWKVEDPRPRRYYRRSDLGSQLLAELKEELKKQNDILEEIIYEKHE